jgi:hypothetical protein
MTTIDNLKSDRFVSLRSGLQREANAGYQILVATMGTNGNGGATADAQDLLEAGTDGYEPVTFTAEEFAKHCIDARVDGDGDAGDFIAYDRHQLDEQGYLTGLVERVYIDLVV